MDQIRDRDPILAAALAAHGREWRPDLANSLTVPPDDVRNLPSIRLRSLDHELTWSSGDELIVLHQQWRTMEPGREGWSTRLTTPALPETVTAALEGRGMRSVIDVPGAEAWVIEKTETFTEIQTVMTLVRAATGQSATV